MLRLKNITKIYSSGNNKVLALDKVNLSFRQNEFVSILGPSGCGKTTILNIIGGLDKYTDGDLYINGKSTKKFKNRDWDVYRNHRVGFIFQSYNLIPHQNILSNVELALKIAGMSKKRRINRAKKALDLVGLKGLYKKKPNQLSGGQCQRVAIARALVNNPEILLADEPTGALDTVTSTQIMDLIKKISKKKLVIMVTHNPDIANKYSTRIIDLLDGKVLKDSNPFTPIEERKECVRINKEKERVLAELKARHEKSKETAKMGVGTSFKLSLQNLRSKGGRTTLVSFAGSIGIIGVSLVLAVSAGIHNYINNMQDDLLSGNPVTIRKTALDVSQLTSGAEAFQTASEIEIIDGKINVNSIMEYMVDRSETMQNMTYTNDITEDYIQYLEDMPQDYYASIDYNYGIDPINNFYTTFKASKDDEYKIQSLSSIVENYKAVISQTDYSRMSSTIDLFYTSIEQLPTNKDYIDKQYDLLYGEFPTKENEIMVVASKNRQLSDVLLGELGYYTQDEFLNIVYRASKDGQDNYDASLDKMSFTYEEILNNEIYYVPNDLVYSRNEESNKPNLIFDYNYKLEDTYASGVMKMKITGILQPKDNISYGCMESGFYYTKAFTERFLNDNKESEIVNYLVENDQSGYTSTKMGFSDMGVAYDLTYKYDGEEKTIRAYVGTGSTMSSIFGMIGLSMSSYKTLSLENLGGGKIPTSINIYPIDFDSKDIATNYLDKWNENVDIKLSTGKVLKADDREEVKYTDTIGLIISMINLMIDIISIALIVFTALSLVVSTVMIGIITYVSVVERVKEIGVIRSLGGRKRDVSRLFFVETVVIGFISGCIGIGITYLISLIINVILYPIIHLNICALPYYQALIMIGISVLLTLISGIIPARAAANKDPVVALRTE